MNATEYDCKTDTDRVCPCCGRHIVGGSVLFGYCVCRKCERTMTDATATRLAQSQIRGLTPAEAFRSI